MLVSAARTWMSTLGTRYGPSRWTTELYGTTSPVMVVAPKLTTKSSRSPSSLPSASAASEIRCTCSLAWDAATRFSLRSSRHSTGAPNVCAA